MHERIEKLGKMQDKSKDMSNKGIYIVYLCIAGEFASLAAQLEKQYDKKWGFF